VTEEAYREQIPEALTGQRIDRVVALVGDVSRRQAAAMISAGQVLVDGVTVAKVSLKLQLDQVLEFALVRERFELIPDPSVEFSVVHADDDVIVVDKPAGLVVHPGSGVKDSTLVNGLLARFPELATVGQPERPGIVHRLDRGTSGLLMVARTERAYGDLVDQLQHRLVERRYQALVVGHVEAEEGLIDAPLGRSPRDPTKRAVVADGLEARTGYEVLERVEFSAAGVADGLETSDDDVPMDDAEVLMATRLVCRLETGRTHQIRAHLAAIGHPVVGDVDYGGPALPGHQSRGSARPFLHAERLGFVHPATDQELAFDSPLPADLQAVLDAAQRGR